MNPDFFKLSGSGNDFVMLDGREHSEDEWPAGRISRVCARATGVGADGLAIVQPLDEPDHVRFLFFNSDGSAAPMCGNGALCATRLAGDLGLASRSGMTLVAGAGNYVTRWASDDGRRISIELGDAVATEIGPIDLQAGELSVAFFTVGVPHLVVHVEDVDSIDLVRRGRDLRYHPSVAPGGANVNFVSGNANAGWFMRTYERGVEDETLACGTGAVACMAHLCGSDHQCDLPVEVKARSGSVLCVEGRPRLVAGGIQEPVLTGPVDLVFRGKLVDV